MRLTMMAMHKDALITLRIPSELIAEVDEIGGQMGASRSHVVRLAIKAFILEALTHKRRSEVSTRRQVVKGASHARRS